MLNRRQTLRGALTIGAVSFGFASHVAAAAGLQPLAWTPKALRPDQARLLETVTELMIPATDTPGATAAGVPQFIDRALGNYCDAAQAQLLKAGLAKIDADALAANGATFLALTPDQQVALLRRYDTEATAARRLGQPHFFSVLKELATIGYFTSQPGATQALRYDPVPGDYHGCVPLSQIGRAWAT